LLAGTSAIAYHSYSKSRDLTAVARQDRTDALTAERTIGAFWREREPLGEYVTIPTRSLAKEAHQRRAAFEALALQSAASTSTPESRRESIFFARALRANAALVAVASEPVRTAHEGNVQGTGLGLAIT
jgi:hypothetical protein